MTPGWGVRLRDERKRLGLSQDDFAAKAEVSKNTQIAYEGERTTPKAKYLRLIEPLGVDVFFVLNAERGGPAWMKQARMGYEAEPADIHERAAGDVAESVDLPEVDIAFAMGGGLVLEDHSNVRTIRFPKDWIRGLIKGSFAQLFVARGEGDSMEPTLRDGDVIIVDTSQQSINSQDRLWALSYGDLGMIKRVIAEPGGGLLVKSDNPAAGNFTAHDGEVQVVGRVVWIGRRV